MGLRDDSISILSDTPRRTLPTPVKVMLFLFFWVLAGFALGTVVLLFPVRWWATFCRSNFLPPMYESAGVVVLILALVIISASIALGLATRFVRTPSNVDRVVIPLVAICAAGVAYSFWMNPKSLKSSMAAEQEENAHFTFGPLPDRDKLAQLKRQGYTAVISLLHPAVVPFEPQFIEQEKIDAQAVGIELIHLPMLPWVSENTESINKLKEIAARKTGRYYVHCYLGTDRTNVARRIIEQASGGMVIVDGGGIGTRRKLADGQTFERGGVHKLADGVFLIPFPTAEEYVGYVLAGQVKNVIAVLDAADPGDRKRIDEEKVLLQHYSLPYHLFEAGSEHYDPQKVLDAVKAARTLEKPLVIHAFFTPPVRKTAIVEAIAIAWHSDRPPLSPLMWQRSLDGGPARVVAPHVAAGPRPTPEDLRGPLRNRGVRSLIYVGPKDSAPGGDREAAAAADLAWKASPPDSASLIKLLSAGGPYYIYGPDSNAAIDAIRKEFGDAKGLGN